MTVEGLGSIFSTADGSAGCVAEYANMMSSGHPSSARQHLLGALAGRSEHAWLECARALVLRADIPMATALLAAAMAEHPNSGEVRFALAGMYQQANQTTAAEALLRELLLQQPDHVAATFLLVHILKDAGRMQAAADAARALFQQGRHALADVIQAVELLDECDRKQDAAAICEGEIAAGATDPRLHAYAGMLLTQLGQFELARQRYLFAFGAADQAAEWNIPLGLAGLQRYANRHHPDLVLFQNSLQRADLSDRARGSLLFALAKAHDDLGDYAQAAQSLRQANALLHASLRWSRKLWRRGIDARIARRVTWPRLAPPSDWTPMFIVGMPRSGTTLLAELLSRHPDVCNRGELAWMQQLEQQLAPADEGNRAWLESAAATYQAQLRQDDSDARWFIDKQPHNFLCVDLILALFPNARIIYCQRNARDNALSLWSQCFVADAQRFSYDFSDIAAVSQGCRRVMAHWQTRYPGAIQTVRYEQLTADPTGCIAALATWLALPACDLLGAKSKPTAISTASLWQARQPVYTRSVERWRHYAPYLPELLQFPDN
jgi:tetratricopeptide (TPR) repeat protein